MNSTLTSADRKQIKTAESISLIVASVLGVIFHFVYDWTSQNRFIGFFVPVNESVWEHLKLIFYPIALVSVIEYYLIRARSNNYLCMKVCSIWIGMLSTVTLFYTCTGVIGRVIDWLNIVIYFVSMCAAYCYSCRCMLGLKPTKNIPLLCILSFTVIAILFMIFSLYPPSIGIFQPPT